MIDKSTDWVSIPTFAHAVTRLWHANSFTRFLYGKIAITGSHVTSHMRLTVSAKVRIDALFCLMRIRVCLLPIFRSTHPLPSSHDKTSASSRPQSQPHQWCLRRLATWHALPGRPGPFLQQLDQTGGNYTYLLPQNINKYPLRYSIARWQARRWGERNNNNAPARTIRSIQDQCLKIKVLDLF